MSFFDQSRLNKVLKGVGRVKAKAEMALIGGGERISVGKTKAIAAKAAGDPGIANRVNVTYTGRGEKGIFPGLPGTNSGSHYNPATDTIQTAPNAAVAAHEGTHAAQARWISKTAERLGLPPEVAKQAPTAIFTAANMGAKGAAGAAATDKLGTGGRVTGAVLGHIPQLALEGHATIKGTLSQPGGVRTALGSFGSYATAAGANIRKAMKPRELSARDELESIILFRSQEGAERDRYGNLKKAAIAAGVLGAAGGGIYAAKKIGRGVGRLAKGGEDVLKRVSGVLGEVHHNAADIGQYAHAAIPKAEAYVASTAPKVEAYVKDHIIPITEKAKGVVETMHKGLQPMRDYGAIYRAGREGAFFVPKLTSNPKKWWSNVKSGWSEGRHGAPATMDPYYHDPEIAAKAQPHIERWVKRIGKTKESIAKRAPEAGRPFATSAGPVMQWSARDELDQIINFNLAGIGKALWRGTTGRAALKWGGIGAAGGAIAGGVSGALSDDPNKTALGGALGGAMAGGALGALGGGGMRAYKTYGRGTTRSTSLGLGGAAAAPSAAPSQVAGQTTHGSSAYANTSVADALAAKKAAQAPTAAVPGQRSSFEDTYGIKRKPQAFSAREELDLILFKKKGGDYKRHWSQKKTDLKKKSTKKERDAEENEQHRMSAREELEVIQLGGLDGFWKLAKDKTQGSISRIARATNRYGSEGKGFSNLADSFRDNAPALTGRVGRAKIQGGIVKQIQKATGRTFGLSARDQLNTILLGVDTRPRDPMGRFDQAEDGAPNPNAMRATYGTLAAGAAGGVAGAGAMTGLKALAEKLRKVKK
jgi:hypothetical protein